LLPPLSLLFDIDAPPLTPRCCIYLCCYIYDFAYSAIMMISCRFHCCCYDTERHSACLYAAFIARLTLDSSDAAAMLALSAMPLMRCCYADD